MNKLGAPVDNALLAAKLAPRLERIALQQGQVATDAAAGPVVHVAPVVNDVRLPSHLALERQLPAGAATAPAPSETAAGAPGEARLSAAARLIGALLAALPDAGPVRDAAPLWPSARQLPAGAALAGALAQAVDRSGLFYESHLAQFVAGARTLAQLAQEPQAHWGPPAPAHAEAGGAAAAASASAAMAPAALEAARAGSPAAAMPMAAVSLPAAGDQVPSSSIVLPAVPRPAPAEALDSVPTGPQPPAEAAVAAAPLADVERVRAVYRAGEGAAASAGIGPERRAGEAGEARQGVAPAPSVRQAQPGEMIHPQSVTVVHQQLDLLATAMFRWSGQAWPGVAAEWSIQEEGAHRDDLAQAPQLRRWSTMVSLDLPRLGPVEFRLSLAGGRVEAQFVANEAATAARLRAQGEALERRFEAAGLRLESWRVSKPEQAS